MCSKYGNRRVLARTHFAAVRRKKCRSFSRSGNSSPGLAAAGDNEVVEARLLGLLVDLYRLHLAGTPGLVDPIHQGCALLSHFLGHPVEFLKKS